MFIKEQRETVALAGRPPLTVRWLRVHARLPWTLIDWGIPLGVIDPHDKQTHHIWDVTRLAQMAIWVTAGLLIWRGRRAAN